MDFDSPDVAKEFPGLARALTDVNEYDDWDKSKKKKDKKDSKKEKDKGYAALNDSPDEDEAETKSPGKSIKIKAFKLTSKKKDKEKKEKEVLPATAVVTKTADKERAKSLCNELDTRVMRNRDDPQTHSTGAVAIPEQVPVQRRPFDGQGYKHAAAGVLSKSSKKLKHSVSNASSSSVVLDEPHAHGLAVIGTATSEKKGLNVFLNAPVPLLSKKKDHKEKDSKKEDGATSSSKGKLKLKKIGKTSFEEPSTSGQDVAQPDDPEQISKEIKKYEAMLEQAHAQVKSGKKVSKKAEDQLWELQMTLTQLKRKLRSINALSASFSVPPPSTPAAAATTTTATNSVSTSTVAESDPVGVGVPHTEVKCNVTDAAKGTSPSPKAAIPHSTGAECLPEKTLVANQPITLTPKEASNIATSNLAAATSTLNPAEVHAPISQPVTSEQQEMPNSEITLNIIESTPEVNAASELGQPIRLTDVELDRRDTIQVKVEVHSKEVSINENPTPEDIYEQEITSFNEADNIVNPTGKRENIEKGRRLLYIPATPESSKSKSEEPPSSTGEESVKRIDSEAPRSEVDPDEGDYVLLKVCPDSTSQKGSVEDIKSHGQPGKKIVTAPSIFDPFALPEFKTDEFIAAENEALILFTQQLQDEIVKEEEQIEELIRQIQQISLESKRNTCSDLEQLDDDELVNVWQAVKLENDTLNEQVLNLKLMVANSRLEEFRLETRVKYLQEKGHGRNEKFEPKVAVA